MEHTKAQIPAKYPQASRINAEAYIETQEDGTRAVVIRLGLVEENQEELLAQAIRLGTLKIETLTRMTRRERECAESVMQGKSGKETAADLHLSERTVKFHLSNVYAKYGVSGRVALAMLFLQKAREAVTKAGVDFDIPSPEIRNPPHPHRQ